jgi:hypothetical protein
MIGWIGRMDLGIEDVRSGLVQVAIARNTQ